MYKRVLVIGGAGYIGSHTAKYLSQNGYEVVIYDNLSTGYEQLAKYGKLIVGELADRESLRELFRSYNFDAVFHFAAFAYVGESVLQPRKYYNNNVVNTLNLLDIMLEFNVKKIIFSSTCATFGNPLYLPIDEQHLQNPINPYGRTKLYIENILKDYSKAYGLKFIVLRYFNAAGADLDGELGEMHNPETHLIPLAIDTVLGKREVLKVFGNDYETTDGSCIRDYIHVTDLADAHIKAYEYLSKNMKSDFFNLGSQNGYSVFEIIDIVQKLERKKISYMVDKKRDGDPSVLIASSKKIYEKLKWKPKFSSIEIIIASALKWHKGLV